MQHGMACLPCQADQIVAYISAAMLDANDTDYYDLKGALVYGEPTQIL